MQNVHSHDDAKNIRLQIPLFYILEIPNLGIQKADGHFFDNEVLLRRDTSELSLLVLNLYFEYVTYSYCALLLSDYLP